MVYLKAAAQLNDIARVFISTLFVIISAESDCKRDQAIDEIAHSISSMHKLLANSPYYHHYFKNLIIHLETNL